MISHSNSNWKICSGPELPFLKDSASHSNSNWKICSGPELPFLKDSAPRRRLHALAFSIEVFLVRDTNDAEYHELILSSFLPYDNICSRFFHCNTLLCFVLLTSSAHHLLHEEMEDILSALKCKAG